MKNGRHVKIWMKITAYLIAACILFSQSMVGMATEVKSQLSEENTQESEEDDAQDADIASGENAPTDDAGLAEEADESSESSELTEESAAEAAAQIEDLEAAQDDLLEIAEQKSILALVYLCNKYEVKDTPSKDGNTVVSVVSGQSVQIEGVDLDKEGNVWYKVSLYQKEKNYTGYIEKKYLATSDEEFLDWTDEYVEEEQISAYTPKTMSILMLSDYPDVNQFPASYQNALLALKQKYPNWIFVKMETGLNFNTAVSQELGDKSWISNSQPASWRDRAAAQSGWSIASEGILRYYMDPRNFLTESTIFQFEQLTYNESYHTETAVQAIITNSFMSGDIPGEDMTYARAFTKIGEELKISPFHLASRVLQEQGTKGTSQLISGVYGEYAGYYNYFNVGASGRDIELIVNGLKEAQKRGWDTRYKSLYGGASVIGQNYILRGQDTLYLQKFNVTSNSTYNHQYMQNIQAPASEAPSIQKAYSNTGALNNSFVFKIPVYSNMPASACPQPDKTDVITLNKSTISSLAVDKTEKLIPYVNGSKPDNVNDMIFTSSNTDVATVDAQGVIKAISPGTAVITCARSGASGATCTVTVVKAEPVVDTPVLSPVVYKKGLKLGDVSLPTGWAWSNKDTVLEAGTASYPAVYTPEDTTRYLTVTKQIGLKVSQAIPSCTVPENLTAKVGSTLSSIALPEGFIWESDAETILDQAGELTFYLSYYPSDHNYFEMLHIPVLVKVIDDKSEAEEPDEQGGTLPGGDVGGSSTGNSGGNSGSGTGGSGSDSNSGGTGSSGNGGSGGGTDSPDEGNSSGKDGSGSNGGSDTEGTGSDSTTSSSGSTTSSGENPTSSSDSTMVSSGNSSTSNGTMSSGSTSSSGGSTDSSQGTVSSDPASSNGSASSNSSPASSNDPTSSNSGPASSNSPTGSNTNPAGNSDSAASNAVTPSDVSTPSSGGTNDSGSNQSNDNSADSNSTISSDIANNSSTANNDAAGNNSTAVSDAANNISAAGSDATGSRSSGADSNSSSTVNRVIARNSSNADNHSTLLVSEETETEEIIAEPIYERPAVAMDMEDISILTEEMLQMAKEQNIDLILTMNNRAKWHVNASTAAGGSSDIDMGVLFENGVIPIELLEDAAEGNEYLEFMLAHDGPFGFMAELEIALNPEDCGRYANLFYFNPEAETLEFICASVIDENGYARFSMEHASCYVIIISDTPMTGIAVDNSEASGIGIRWIIFGVLILIALAAAGAGGYFFWRKQQEDEEDGGEYVEEDEEDYIEEDGAGKEDEYVEEDNQDYGKEEYVESAEQDIAEAEVGEDTEKELQVLSVEKVVPEQYDKSAGGAEDDWIEDEDWQEPEKSEEKNPYADDHAEDDWIEDDEWDISNDWMDDEEWEKRRNIKKTAV